MIIDAGRLGLVGSPEPLIYAADLMLLVMRSDLVALAAARSWAETLRAGFDERARRPVCKPCWWGRAGLTADGMLPRFGAAGGGGAGVAGGGGRGLFSRSCPAAPFRRPGFAEELAGGPGSDRVGDRGRCGPARRAPRDGEVLMGEPAFRDSDDPADLPLFAARPASRPGRVRSTFSMRSTRPPPRRCRGSRVADRLAGQESAAGVGSMHSAGRLGSTGVGGLVVGGAAANAGIGTAERRWAMGRATWTGRLSRKSAAPSSSTWCKRRRRSACPPASGHGRCWSRTPSRRRSSMPCSGWAAAAAGGRRPDREHHHHRP